jgi:pimeloyl-ACP methyl ester carboxylesterase
MRFRTSDQEAVAEFSRLGLTLTPHTLAVGKRSMHYVSTGSPEQPTLVFVHGSPGSWDSFKAYLKDSLLLEHYRMVSLDRPGFGYSDFGQATGIQQQADLLGPVLHKLANGKPMYLIGHSLGGPMIIKLAADNPDLPIKGLVLLAGSVSPADEPREPWRAILDTPPLRYLLPGAIRASNHELRLFKKDIVTMQPAFAHITCPVFILHGDKDPLVPPPNAVYAQKMLINSAHIDLFWLKGANHFIPWTRYPYIRAVLLQPNMYQ